MDKINMVIAILAGVALLGVIVLLFKGQTVDVLLPILTTLIGVLIGAKKEQIVGLFSKK